MRLNRAPAIVLRSASWCVAAVWVAACGGPPAGSIAYTDDASLSVDDAVTLLDAQPQLPANRGVVRALADLWLDYTLLARAAREDSTLAQLDVERLMAQRLDQDLILALRGQVIQVDTILEDEELRFLYQQDQPGAQVSARHILLPFDQRRAEARDSAVALARELRSRLIGGADFASLAREFSGDPATASQGGNLGSFTRERMVPEFGDAAFALEPGEISQPVVTQFGVHLIRVDSKELRDFSEVRDAYRNVVINRRVSVAESTYVSGIEARAEPVVTDGAYDVMRKLGDDPGTPLGARAAAKPLVEYATGVYTVGEFRTFIQNQSPAYRTQVAEATDEQLQVALLGLTRGKLLVEEARAQGLAPEMARLDSLTLDTRAEIVDAARRLGVLGAAAPDDPQPIIRTALGEMLSGARDVIPMGAVGFALRDLYDGAVVVDGVTEATVNLEARRTQADVAPPAFPVPEAVPAPPVDSTGSPEP